MNNVTSAAAANPAITLPLRIAGKYQGADGIARKA